MKLRSYDFVSNRFFKYSKYIWRIYCAEYSSLGLLVCDAVFPCGRIPNFQRSMLPSSSGWSDNKSKPLYN